MSSIAFVGVGVVDVEAGQTRDRQTVIVRDKYIQDLGPMDELQPPADAFQIDGRGKVLIPGLADMHVHITPHAPSPGVDEDEALRRAREFLLVCLASGVTTIRNMAGTPLHLKLRDEVATSVTIGPRILSCGPVLETRFTFAELAEFGELVRTPEEGRAAVRSHKLAGFDFIKVYNDIDANIYDTIIDEARKIGIPVVGHVAFQKGLFGALEAKQDSIEHLRSYDFAVDTRSGDIPRARFEGWLYATPQRISELAERTAEAGVWNAPTLVVERSLRTDEEMNEARQPIPEEVPDWLKRELEASDLEPLFTSTQREVLGAGRDARAAMVNALDDVRAGLLAGSDCPGCRLVPGRSLLRELELFVDAGLSPARALLTATTSAQQFLGCRNAGRVAPGMRADLVLLDRDPLVDIKALHQQAGVVVAGHWLPKEELARRLLGS
jgi:imidazolonepropionase-like amidohydrolase